MSLKVSLYSVWSKCATTSSRYLVLNSEHFVLFSSAMKNSLANDLDYQINYIATHGNLGVYYIGLLGGVIHHKLRQNKYNIYKHRVRCFFDLKCFCNIIRITFTSVIPNSIFYHPVNYNGWSLFFSQFFRCGFRKAFAVDCRLFDILSSSDGLVFDDLHDRHHGEGKM